VSIAELNKISFNVVLSGVTRNETALTDRLRRFTEFKIAVFSGPYIQKRPVRDTEMITAKIRTSHTTRNYLYVIENSMLPASRRFSSNINDGHTKSIILRRPAIIGISS
jgi:hypothetical protein